jgi:hypothetical protein
MLSSSDRMAPPVAIAALMNSVDMLCEISWGSLMLYARFDSNAVLNLNLSSKQMNPGKAAQSGGSGAPRDHADMDHLLDIPMPFLYPAPPDRRFGSISAGCCP